MNGKNRFRTTILPALFGLLALPRAATAQGLSNYDYDNLTFRGIGVDWGRISPNKVNATNLYGLRVDLGFLGPAIRFIPSVSWWKSELKRSELESVAARLSELPAIRERGVTINADDLGTVEWSTLSLSVDTHVVWTAPAHIFTYAGLGVGLHAMNGKGASINDTFIEDLLDTITAGVAFMGGLEYQATRIFRVYGEARYTIQSEIRYPAFRLGLALMVPNRTGGTQ
jgi:hypothetical protein